jgi:hypothetical protein
MFVKVPLFWPLMAVMLTMKSSSRSGHQLLQLWTAILSSTAIQNHKQESQVTDRRIPTPLMMVMTVILILIDWPSVVM